MRRIFVENARRKLRLRHGGGQERVDFASVAKFQPAFPEGEPVTFCPVLFRSPGSLGR